LRPNATAQAVGDANYHLISLRCQLVHSRSVGIGDFPILASDNRIGGIL
jgi:hypothetical protein